jgi:hypothetical protein
MDGNSLDVGKMERAEIERGLGFLIYHLITSCAWALTMGDDRLGEHGVFTVHIMIAGMPTKTPTTIVARGVCTGVGSLADGWMDTQISRTVKVKSAYIYHFTS